jgi:hypothetical protein
MKTERFYLRKDDHPITAAMLREDPDKYGGLSIHMLNAIQSGVTTIPLTSDPSGGCGSCVSIQVTSEEIARRVISDNGVDIQSKGYWCSILNARPVFVGTDEPVPMWGVDVGDSLAKAGLIAKKGEQ